MGKSEYQLQSKCYYGVHVNFFKDDNSMVNGVFVFVFFFKNSSLLKIDTEVFVNEM